MTSTALAFAEYSPLTAAALETFPSTLPPNSSITAKLHSVADGKLVSPYITCYFRKVVLPGTLGSAAPQYGTSDKLQVQVKLKLDSSLAHLPQELSRTRLDSARTLLVSLVGQLVTISVSGGIFSGVEHNELGRSIIIECAGDRLAGVVGRHASKIELGTPAAVRTASKAPSWLLPSSPVRPSAMPHSGPSVSHPPPHQPTSTSARGTGGSSHPPPTQRLQPLSSHMPKLDPSSAPQSQLPQFGKRRYPSDGQLPDSSHAKRQKMGETLGVRSHSDFGHGSQAGTAAPGGSTISGGQGRGTPGLPGGVQPTQAATYTHRTRPVQEPLPSATPILRAAEISHPQTLSRTSSTSSSLAGQATRSTSTTSSNRARTDSGTSVEGAALRAAAIAEAKLASSADFPPRANAPIQSTRPPAPPAGAAAHVSRASVPSGPIAINRVQIVPAGASPHNGNSAPSTGRSQWGGGTAGGQGGSASMGGGGQTTYTDIAGMGAKVRGIANAMVIIQESMAAITTRTGDWMRSYRTTDPSATDEDLIVALFRRTEEEVPVLPPGTPVLLQGMSVTEYKNKPKCQGFSKPGNSWAMLKDGQLLRPEEGRILSPISEQDIQDLKDMKRWWDETHGRGSRAGGAREGDFPVHRQAITSGRKMIELKDAVFRAYCDITVKILQVAVPTSGTTEVEVCVTDGTKHSQPLWDHHGVASANGLPLGTVWQMSIETRPDDAQMQVLAIGNVVRLTNVLPKENKKMGPLELRWCNKNGAGQEHYQPKKAILIPPGDSRALAIEERLRVLRGGSPAPAASVRASPMTAEHAPVSAPPQPSHRPQAPAAQPSHRPQAPAQAPALAPALPPLPASAPAPCPPVKPTHDPFHGVPKSTQISTVNQDPVRHPLTPLSDIAGNGQVPNRFKVRARVEKVSSTGKVQGSLVIKYCKRCERSFDTAFCLSCNDSDWKATELRYRFVIILTDARIIPAEGQPPSDTHATLTVLVSDSNAADFLPPLPPVDTSNNNPNKQRSLDARLMSISANVKDLLLGPKIDGVEPRPEAEWCVESYTAKPKQGKKKGKKGKAAAEGTGKEVEGYVMHRVFGMQAARHA